MLTILIAIFSCGKTHYLKMDSKSKAKSTNDIELYPDIKKTAYNLNQQLRGIYNNNNDKHIAMTKLAHW